MRNLVLIGYRGTGKSAVARELADRLDWTSVDADDQIEPRAGMTIAEIFATHGEEAFRDWESQVLCELLENEHQVIAAGGGVVLRQRNRELLATAGAVVWLQATIKTILERVAADPMTSARRPNLTVSGGEDEVRILLEAREPLYRQCATLTVITDSLSPVVVADRIFAQLNVT
ncbi:MAG TPA: shikimate kinase [Pirellulales bacterium]|jgi:shikimate kinase|nr:shikimate kinase [Pirellulales bacterium]